MWVFRSCVQRGLCAGVGSYGLRGRVAGVPLAIDWITGGAPAKAPAALAVGVVDAVSAPEALRGAALDKLREATASIDWRVRRKAKASALPLGADEAKALFDEAKAKPLKRAAPHQPAALSAVELMAVCAPLRSEEHTSELQYLMPNSYAGYSVTK